MAPHRDTHEHHEPTGAVIRRLWPADLADFRAHLKRLDPESRAMRFGGAVSDEFLDAYADTAHRLGTFLFGAFVDQTLVGVAELRMLLDADLQSAEAAFSVEREWQDAGIGDALLGRVIVAAQNRGIRNVFMICLQNNVRMRHLAEKHAAEIEFAGGDVKGTLRHLGPTPSSIIEEMFGEAQGFATALLRL